MRCSSSLESSFCIACASHFFSKISVVKRFYRNLSITYWKGEYFDNYKSGLEYIWRQSALDISVWFFSIMFQRCPVILSGYTLAVCVFWLRTRFFHNFVVRAQDFISFYVDIAYSMRNSDYCAYGGEHLEGLGCLRENNQSSLCIGWPVLTIRWVFESGRLASWHSSHILSG